MDLDGLAQGLNAAFGRNVPLRSRQGGSGISFDITEEDMKAIVRLRPGADTLRELRGDRSKADTFLSQNQNNKDRKNRIVACSLLRGGADDLCKQGRYDEAKLEYEKATKAILGKDFSSPLPVTEGLQNEVYTKLDPWDRIVLMECCNGMAQCMIKLKCPERVRRFLSSHECP
jgi:hypothetical protein